MVDLVIIIGHSLTPNQIIQFPEKIDNWQQLKDIYLEEYESKLEYNYSLEQVNNSLYKKSSWSVNPITEIMLINSWESNINLITIEEEGYFWYHIDTYFGQINFCRNTIIIKLYPEHKYGTLLQKANLRFILKFNREFAKVLEQKKVFYCADSLFPCSIFEDEAIEGKTIEEIITLSKQKFGTPSLVLEKAIYKGFFIDDISVPILKLTS